MKVSTTYSADRKEEPWEVLSRKPSAYESFLTHNVETVTISCSCFGNKEIKINFHKIGA
jgi:hypothetical protein